MQVGADQQQERAAPGDDHSHEHDYRHAKIVLAGATLVFLAGSYVSETWNAPAALVMTLNVLSYAAGGWFGVVEAAAALRERKLDINLLMIVAALGAAAIGHWHEGATLLFLFSLSNALQALAMERSRSAISGLIKLRPTQATVLRDGVESRVPIEALRRGDVVIVRPGEMIPTDGVIYVGVSDLNQSAITGESVPVDRSPGDAVFAGSLNGAGALEIEVSRPAEDSTLARMIQLVESARQQRARTQRFFERIEAYYAGGVLLGAALFILVPWLIQGAEFSAVFYRSMVLLVVASPCALVLATPAPILAAIANGARHGILFKGGIHLENLAEVRAVAIDKTGTLTSGELRVTDIVPSQDHAGETHQLLAAAAALEARSEHPIARAIVLRAQESGGVVPPMTDFRNLPGHGVFGRVGGYLTWIGGQRMFQQHGEEIPPDVIAAKERLERDGKTVLIVHREIAREGDIGRHERDGGWLGVIAIADTVRPESAAAVRALRAVGIRHITILTGDNPSVAAAVARQTGVEDFAAQLLPEEKVAAVRRMIRSHGPVLMVGDGVNDAPALAAASVGAAMGAAGSDVALETADLVLMSSDLGRVPYAVQLSRRTQRVIWQNVMFAFAVIVVLVVATFGWRLPMPLGVVGHEGSTLLVVANGLRLLRRNRRPGPGASEPDAVHRMKTRTSKESEELSSA